MSGSLNRLQQEVSVLVKDLETSSVTIKEFQSRLTVSERRGDDLAAKLREMTNLFEKADKENKGPFQKKMFRQELCLKKCLDIPF